LSNLDGDEEENFVGLLYNYLQFSYYKGIIALVASGENAVSNWSTSYKSISKVDRVSR
jgi:hypothetical protein